MPVRFEVFVINIEQIKYVTCYYWFWASLYELQN